MNLKEIQLQLLAILGRIKEIIMQRNLATPAGELLYKTALGCLGKDASPMDRAPDSVGCADSVNMIYKKAFGKEIGGEVSTAGMYQALRYSPNFLQVYLPLRGDIIISPTGYGNGKIPSGHVGILADAGQVMSNTSATGLWTLNYTIATWTERWGKRGGYPVFFYRPIIK